MPTKIAEEKIPACSRCGRLLTYGTQADHNADYRGAEAVLALVESAQPDEWLMGTDNRNHREYRLGDRAFLPALGFGRKDGEHACGHQLHYMLGSYWPRYGTVQKMRADEALRAGMVPWEAFFSKYEGTDVCWPPVAEALMRLDRNDLREILLGRPIPRNRAAQNDSFDIVEIAPTQFWRRLGSMPVRDWADERGGYLHLAAYQAIDRLNEDGLLENCLPDKSAIFRAFDLVSPESVRVVILGQDPYPDPDDAMGLAFSSKAPKLPASLRNIYQEMADDLGVSPPSSGDLTHWAYQGVLLANTALTIGKDGRSHASYWGEFTQTWIRTLATRRSLVWVLWGSHARKWAPLIQQWSRHFGQQAILIESAHPSPLSARRGFFGSKPFSKINEGLARLGMPRIEW